MNQARLWKKILEEAIAVEAQAIHLEPEVVRFKHQYMLNDAFELNQEEYEQLFGWLELLGEKARIKNVDLKIELHPQKAIVRIFKKSDRYLNNLKGLYFFDNKEALEEALDYLAKKDLQIVSLEKDVELKPDRGLTAGRAIDYLKSDVIIVPQLEEDILEAVIKKAATGKLVLVSGGQEDKFKSYLIDSVFQGVIK